MLAKDKDYIKQRTIELYDSLPMNKEERIKRIDVRDEIIDLNYTFFGYVASGTFVENTTYEDKFQTALMAFLSMWWKYKYTPEYRGDLSFAVFFKPRISEEIRRYLSTVSYTQRRTVCRKAAAQLGKPWNSITYDDLPKVNLPAKDMQALKCVLGAHMPVDLSECELFIGDDGPNRGIDKYVTSKFDTVEELLVQETIESESQLTDKQLHAIAEMYSLDYDDLKSLYPKALQSLYDRLKENL